MHLVTGQLGHGGVRVIVVLAGLLDLFLERLLVFLRGGKTFGCGVGLVLSGGGILVGLRDLVLGGDNLVVRQIIQLKYLIRQFLAGTGQLLLEFGLALYRRGVLVLRSNQVGIGVCLGRLCRAERQTSRTGCGGHQCRQCGLDHTYIRHM